MDTQRIVSELKQQRDRLDQAIAALEQTDGGRSSAKRLHSGASHTGRKRWNLSAAAKKRISDAMRKSWAERRKKSAGKN